MIINKDSSISNFLSATATASDISSEKTAYGTNGIIFGTAIMILTLSSIPSTKRTDYIIVNNNYYKWSNSLNEYVFIDINNVLTHISVTPSSSSYNYGSSVSATVVAHYINGTSRTVTNVTFTPSTATQKYITVSYTENNITCTSLMPISIKLTSSSYSGTSSVQDEGNGNWVMSLITSGTLTLGTDMLLDIYAVGGGGAGGYSSYGSSNNPTGGGGGGYTDCIKGYLVPAGSYAVIIGNGGAVGTVGQNSVGNTGGASSFGTIVQADGGKGGCGSNVSFKGRGGDGGSGGGGGVSGTASTVGAHSGGSDATDGNGYGGYGLTDTFSVRDFRESSGTLRAGGGGGCSPTHDNSFSLNNGGSGGGGSGQSCGRGSDGTANYGGGGGAGSNWNRSGWTGTYTGGAGGSGIVLIRNARGL